MLSSRTNPKLLLGGLILAARPWLSAIDPKRVGVTFRSVVGAVALAAYRGGPDLRSDLHPLVVDPPLDHQG